MNYSYGLRDYGYGPRRFYLVSRYSATTNAFGHAALNRWVSTALDSHYTSLYCVRQETIRSIGAYHYS